MFRCRRRPRKSALAWRSSGRSPYPRCALLARLDRPLDFLVGSRLRAQARSVALKKKSIISSRLISACWARIRWARATSNPARQVVAHVRKSCPSPACGLNVAAGMPVNSCGLRAPRSPTIRRPTGMPVACISVTQSSLRWIAVQASGRAPGRQIGTST